jgi:hypothetical protein
MLLKELMFKEVCVMTYRLHLKNRKRFFFLMGILGFVIVLLSTVISAGASTASEERTELLVVSSGDTLWDIAAGHSTKGDIRNYIADVMRMNDLKDGTIYSGQSLLLPIR